MNYARGTCGHIKARWDSHYNCLSCSSCSRFSTCTVCSQWSENAHELPNPATSSRMILPLGSDICEKSGSSGNIILLEVAGRIKKVNWENKK